jgi:hypothetical protein
LKQNFKKESLLQIATQFNLLSHLQNGNKETKIVRVAHIQIGIRKEKHNQGDLLQPSLLQPSLKKINREREREMLLPLVQIATTFQEKAVSQNRNKFSPPLSSLKSQQKNKNNYNCSTKQKTVKDAHTRNKSCLPRQHLSHRFCPLKEQNISHNFV